MFNQADDDELFIRHVILVLVVVLIVSLQTVTCFCLLGNCLCQSFWLPRVPTKQAKVQGKKRPVIEVRVIENCKTPPKAQEEQSSSALSVSNVHMMNKTMQIATPNMIPDDITEKTRLSPKIERKRL
jgi:hypothetical protein